MNAMDSPGGGLTRTPAVAGQFYEQAPVALERDVRSMLAGAPSLGIEGDIYALVAPHAGYVYSGKIAASAYRQVAGREYEAIFIIAPSHHEDLPGASIYCGDAYETPLGRVAIARDIAEDLASRDRAIQFSEAGHRLEHAVEVQLPFLQNVCGCGVEIIPIVIADRSRETCNRLGTAIAGAAEGRQVLIVASSDLYHGYSYDACVRSDRQTLSRIECMDPDGLCEGLENGAYQACGGGPIASAMVAAREMGANRATILASTNSNEVTGKIGGYVVGYGSAVFYKERSSLLQELTPTEKRQLLSLARAQVEASVRGLPPPHPPDPLLAPRLFEKQGGFVTLHRHGSLRGCIGYITAVSPLYRTVMDAAEASSLRDPRFPPVSEAELRDLSIEVSVLWSPVVVDRDEIGRIEIGKHGIIISQGYYHGLLLPQVAVENRWGPHAFIEQTCRKAGLPKDAWKDNMTQIEIFRADVFGEE